MGSIEGVGVQKKLERPTGCAFGRILGMTGGISPILFPSRLGRVVRVFVWVGVLSGQVWVFVGGFYCILGFCGLRVLWVFLGSFYELVGLFMCILLV
jgi:hypothetical protein